MPSGKKIREALSGRVPVTTAEMADMFAADRVIHNKDKEQGIDVMLDGGKTVISDRYYYSSLAYQGSELGYETVAALNLDNPDIRTPDICLFLDLSPEKSLERIGKRADTPTEIYENYDYLEKTRKMFFDVFDRLRARGEHIEIIDASGSAEEISDKIIDCVLPLFD
jgi:dTMP kinase